MRLVLFQILIVMLYDSFLPQFASIFFPVLIVSVHMIEWNMICSVLFQVLYVYCSLKSGLAVFSSTLSLFLHT